MTREQRFDDKVFVCPSGCWLWTACRLPSGYGKFGKMLAHRASWEIAHGPIPDGSLVLHKCHNKSCVNPSHLYLGDHAQNMRDAIEVGAWECGPRSGESNGRAKLTLSEVRHIREAAADRPYRRVAEEHGVSETTVGKIARRELWAHA